MTSVCIKRKDQNAILDWLIKNKLRPKYLEWLKENRPHSNAHWDLFGDKDWYSAVNNQVRVAQATRDIIDVLYRKKEASKPWGEGYSLFYVGVLARFFSISIRDKRKSQLINEILKNIKQLPQSSFRNSSLTRSCFFFNFKARRSLPWYYRWDKIL